MMKVRTHVALAAAALACAWTITPALAQTYPAKTVRVIIPTGPGGGADAQGRLLSKVFTERLGQPFFVDNRPGASGLIGSEIVARAAPDGYTLLVTSSLIAVSASVYTKLPFDPLKDLAAVSQIASAPQVLVVHPSVPAKSVSELVALAKQQKGRMLAGSSGSGSVNHIAIEMLRQAGGITVTHIPYKSGVASGIALMSGEVDFFFSGILQAMPIIRTQRGRPIAVTSATPSSLLPHVPTLDSIYGGFISANWYALFAPGGTPAPIVERLGTEVVNAIKTPEIRDFMKAEGADPVGSTPQEFAIYLRNEIERYRKVVKAAGLKHE
jgi:tripartite-type tricarboxylate transporter receptor subunit TctC